jgi:predicted O-methyltransferase YrrM
MLYSGPANRIKKLLKPAVRSIRRLKNGVELREMESYNGSILSGKIAAAVKEALAVQVSEVERNKIVLIESRRQSLLRDDTKINYEDFGAASSQKNVSLEEAAQGSQNSRPISQIAKASKAPGPCLVLFKLVRYLKPSQIVEMGTCLGISGAYLSAAQELNAIGSLVTLEGSPKVAAVARETLELLNAPSEIIIGPFHATLADTFERNAPVDFLFNDGHHDGRAVLQYHEQALLHLADPAVIFLDDIRWSASMAKAFNIIRKSKEVSMSIDFGGQGLIVWEPGASDQRHFTVQI